MKKLAISSLVLGSLVGLGLNVSAEENTQNIIGENNATVEVEGTLGMDNTKTDAPILEGNDEWINVTVPTKTIFYGTSTQAEAAIKSPNYTIKNNSGRPVEVSVGSFSLKGDDSFKDAQMNLQMNADDKKVELIKASTVEATETPVGTLANSEGKLTKDDEGGKPQSLTFNYTGTYDGTKITKELTTNYNLVLKFKAVSFSK